MKDQGITDTKLSENYDIKTPLECFKIDVEDLSVESRDDLKSDVAVGSLLNLELEAVTPGVRELYNALSIERLSKLY